MFDFAQFAMRAPFRRGLERLALVSALFSVASCGGDGPTENDSKVIASVGVSPSQKSLTVGESATLSAVGKNAAGEVVTSSSATTWTSSDNSVVAVSDAGMVTGMKAGTATITATIDGKSGTGTITVTNVAVASVEVAAVADVVVRGIKQLSATPRSAAGATLSDRTVTWSTLDTMIVRIDATGSLVAVGAGSATVTASIEGKQGTTTVKVLPRSLAIKGLYTQFERRGWPSGYFSGEVIREYNTFDNVVGKTRAAEVSEQLDAIKALNVNTITFELRSANETFDPSIEGPPNCNVSPNLGLSWPQPPQVQLDNLAAFLDLVNSKGMKVLLRLVNSHMDDRPNSEKWIGSILSKIKGKPALELVLFEGDEQLVDKDNNGSKESCGGRAEPPLWLGPNNAVAKYVEWALGYGHSLGYSYRQLSAQASIGNYAMDNNGGAGSSATDNHLWHTPGVMKIIFDRLSVPEAERTYALSFYQTRRCRFANSLPCVEATAAEWADQSMLKVFNAIGFRSPARVIAVEMGVWIPVENGWNSEQALPSLVSIMRNRGVEGGSFWRWTNFENAQDSDPTVETPIKRRGTAYNYTSMKDLLAQLYGQPPA